MMTREDSSWIRGDSSSLATCMTGVAVMEGDKHSEKRRTAQHLIQSNGYRVCNRQCSGFIICEAKVDSGTLF